MTPEHLDAQLRPLDKWRDTDFYEEMSEFYHPGYRKRIWTTPSVDLRNENTVKKSSFKLAAQGDYATGSSSPGRSPRRQNA